MKETVEYGIAPSARAKKIDRFLRMKTDFLPRRLRKLVYSLVASTYPGLNAFRFLGNRDGMEIVSQDGRQLFFPYPIPQIKLSHLALGYVGHLYRKYNAPGFVEVEAGDIVVDCGGFVGGFSISASQKAKMIYVFEPAPQNVDCIAKNFSGANNIDIVQAGLSDVDGQANLNLSESAVEHSFLKPDFAATDDKIEVPIHRLDTFFLEREMPTFVKVEAEGLELEIIEGLGNLRPKKIAVDVSPERDGLSPEEDITKILEGRSYTCKKVKQVLFARLT